MQMIGRKRKEQKRKGSLAIQVIYTVCIAAGLIILLVLFAVRFFNATHIKEEADAYGGYIHRISQTSVEKGMEAVKQYNNTIGDPRQEKYEGIIADLIPEGIVGTLKVPSIGMYIPVYLKMGNRELGQGACHMAGTSLPSGFPDTCCILLGHSGLSYMQIFDNLPDIKVGDRIEFVLFETTYIYKTTETKVVKPEQLNAYLQPETGRTILRLVTCTPPGVNSYRLVVTADLVDTQKK